MNRQDNVSRACPSAKEDSRLVASVIIPVYNGSSTIGRCLNALAQQTVAADRYEIIVVDDGSTDAIETVVAQWCSANPLMQCQLIRQTNQGPAAARNRGAEIAQGRLLLFTDADCRPIPTWMVSFLAAFGLADDETSLPDRAVSNFMTPDGGPLPVSAAMGAYRSDQKNTAARFAQLEFEERFAYMRQQATIDVVATYSAAFRRTVFNEVKGFDPSFPKANNEDVELSYRLSELGHRMIFVPDAIVYHPHNTSWWDYAQTKMGRAYWRTIVYKRYPSKAIKDSYTPQILKVQIILAPFCLLGLLWYLLTREQQALLLLAPFLLTTLPMVQFAFQQKHYALVGWVPWGLWLRSIVFAIGVAMGLLFSHRSDQAAASVLQK